jgi:hypothetical protein
MFAPYALALVIGSAVIGVPLLAKGRVDTNTILAGLGLASIAGLLMRSFGKSQSSLKEAVKDDPFPDLTNAGSQQPNRPSADCGQEADAMQRAIKQARGSYSPAGVEGTLPLPEPNQFKKSVQRQFS